MNAIARGNGLSFFKNMKTLHKLRLGFALLLLFTGALCGISLARARQMDQATNDIVMDALPVNNAARDILLQMVNEETGVQGYLLSGSEDALEPYRQGRRALQDDLAFLAGRFDRHPVMKSLIENEVAPQIRNTQAHFESLIAQVKAGDRKQAQEH